MKNLKILRKEIDKIDKELANTFTKRMNLQKEIAKIKEKENIPTESSSREQEILKKWNSYKYSKELQALYKKIFEISKEFQEQFKKD